VEERGTHESNPNIKRAQKYITLAGDTTVPPTSISDNDLSHMSNWLESLRSRKAPNATVEHGFAHSVAVIMAARSYREGKKLYWDSKTESIMDRAPTWWQ
jgi:hypothetical protein